MLVKMARVLNFHPLKRVKFQRFCQFVPISEGESPRYHDKILKIVEDIGKLTVIELVEFNKCLKTTFNIPEMSAMVPAAGQKVSQGSGSPTEKKPVKLTKTKFFVKLEKFSPDNKIRTIKLVRELNPNLNLVDAKKLVESCPTTVKENIEKDEADSIKAKFEEIGCTIIIE